MASSSSEKTVCLVGNGSSLEGRCIGPVIDSHDVVVRFNEFEITPATALDLGTKFDAWCLWTPFELDSQRLWTQRTAGVPKVVLATSHGKILEEKAYENVAAMCRRYGTPCVPIYRDVYEWVRRQMALTPEERATLPRNQPEWATPSSGALAIGWYLLVEGYSVVSIAGFDHFTKNHRHHYGKPSRPATNLHCGSAEQRWAETLIKEGRIKRL